MSCEHVILNCIVCTAERDTVRQQLAAAKALVDDLESRLHGAEAANAAISQTLVDHVELNGHIETVEQCRDYLDHEAMDSGDPSGKLRDFVTSISVVVEQFDKQRRSRNWYEVAYSAGKQKLIESAVAKAFTRARTAALAYAHEVNQLGLAADDNDPKVMATAWPIGKAQADLWDALGILLENPPCGFGLDGGDCYACQLGKAPLS